MRGHEQVVSLLNDVLTAELTAHQPVLHPRPHVRERGYKRLWKRLREESLGEMKHADKLIERILYLEGVPNVQRLGKVNVGETVPEQLRLDLDSSATPSALSTPASSWPGASATTAAATCSRTSWKPRKSTPTGSRRR
jgi:bacterioferritin